MAKQPENLLAPAERLSLQRERLRQLGCVRIGDGAWCLPGGQCGSRGDRLVNEQEALAWLSQQESRKEQA